MSELRSQLRGVLADRRSPEARALLEVVLRYVQHRARSTAASTWPDLLGASKVDEVVGEVMLQLLSGALARFRGETLPSLLAFVRVITDRTTWHVARRCIQERDALAGEHSETLRGWMSSFPNPEESVRNVPDVALPEVDKAYLAQLLRAGSKANLARERGVSRAAVTLRVQRIRARIDEMGEGERLAVDAWLHREAHNALTEG